jgi:glucosylceramidase
MYTFSPRPSSTARRSALASHSRIYSPLLAIALGIISLALAGCGGGGSAPSQMPTAAAPTFSPAGGSFTATQSVTLSDSTAGATIYYTTDGTVPTTASTSYSAAISVATTTTINAIAVASGYNNSVEATAAYTISAPPTAAPTFSPAAGTFTSTQSVSISDTTTGAAIYYTLDGSTPTTSSTKYSAAISIASTTTINAIAVATGFSNSPVATAAYIINLPAAATPTFSPAAGTFTSAQTVTISDSSPSATIYYTTDGSAPTTASTKYTAPIAVGATTTLKAIATASGFSTSAVATAVFTINLPPAATPTFSPAGGTYTAVQSVTISDATASSTIYYTTDGSTPTTSSTKYTTPISVASSETINAVATATGSSTSAEGTATYTLNLPNTAVNVVISTHDQTKLLAAQSAVAFGSNPAGTNQLLIDEGQQYQTVEGFGAAFTDAAGYVLEKEAQPSELTSILSDLFTRTGNGIGLSFMRNPMGASDLAKTIYTFDDLPAGATDPSLTSFSIAHDQSYILPLVQAAKTLNPQMKLMANPWSPPAWMKNSGSVEGGGLLVADYTPFANYFIKYLQAYQAAGVLPDYISLQNEPLNDTTGYPSMGMGDDIQTTVLRDYILPALTAANLPTKVFVYDHNWDTISYPETVFSDPTIYASPQVAGTAWHGYGGVPGAEQVVQNDYPNKGNWETEHSGGTFTTDQFNTDFEEITLVLRNASKSFVKWSLALDQTMGPNTTQISGGGYSGCNTCTPIVTVNNTTGAVTKDIEYYTLGQYSKFILPGAVRVWSSNTPTIVSVAFINPDGSRALFAYNVATTSQSVQVQWGSQSFNYTMGSQTAATFTWSGTQAGTPNQSAKQQIQGASYSNENGIETEYTGDATGVYDIGYVNNNAYLQYNNVDFGTGVSTVNVRTASAGNGGTLEFHLDSVTGTLLGTATLPVTGGYQTWQTVTAPITGASGVHTLYLVFKGSGGIANLNWFQFQ